MINLPELMTIAELSEYLKCSKAKVYHLIKEKDFPSMQVHGRWYILKSKLPDWIELQTRKCTYTKNKR